MRPGTPGFVGERLREVREARGMTGIALADLLGVSRQAISQYESGKQTPHPPVMKQIAEKLSMPAAYFLRPAPEPRELCLFYRSMAAATKQIRDRAARRHGWLRDIVTYLREFVDFPAIEFPDFDALDDPRRICMADIETVALEVRKAWGMGTGPISNVARLLENHGTIVCRMDLVADALDAFSMWAPDGPYVVLGSHRGSAARSRFDAAHELGHLVLHRRVPSAMLGNAAVYKLMEQQAHRFAGAFLLPAESFMRDLHNMSLEALLAQKTRWKISVGAMLHRLCDLEFISEQAAPREWIRYNARGWKRHEPLDDVLVPEEPQLVKRAFDLILGEGGLSRSAILDALALNQSDIEDLAGLPRGTLSEGVPRLTLVKNGGARRAGT